jgi:predicted RNA-binding Zn-ribbon protein involved in translation (DUF1610 family)
MVTFFYRCPTTGCQLEGRQAAPASAAVSPLVTYVAESCPACGGLHIVNPATGRLMAEDQRPSLSNGGRMTSGTPSPNIWA